jgi:hypothetical protein
MAKKQNKNSGPLASSAKIMIFWVMHLLYKGLTIFSQCGVPIWVSNDAVFDADSKNIKLP